MQKEYETKVIWGVNFRSEPDANAYVYRKIPRGEMIHVITDYDERWLQIEAQDDTIGYISSCFKYTTYVRPYVAKFDADTADKLADALIAEGEKYLGAPYVFGANIGEIDAEGRRVFDCSSFTKTLMQDVAGITMERVSYNQAKQGIAVDRSDLKKGDLMFFSSEARGLEIGHVGIYAGNNKILQTFMKAHGVCYCDFIDRWSERFVTARRFF